MFLEAVRRRVARRPGGRARRSYVDWLVDASCLRRPEDAAHLREGLRLAGLPA